MGSINNNDTFNPLTFCIEYIDPHESNNSIISTSIEDIHKNKKYTHCEIHPSLILGALASCIPFLIIIKHLEYISICYGETSSRYPLYEL